MHRFFLPPGECKNDKLFLAGGEAHHAVHVLRLHRDDLVTVLDGEGQRLACRVDAMDRDTVRLAVESRQRVPRRAWAVTLFQALPKGRIMEDLVEKATQLGVTRIVPMLTSRVVARLDSREAAKKREKWEHVTIESIKQCGSAWLPRIDAPADFDAVVASAGEFDLPLFASLAPGSRHPKHWFDTARAERGTIASACVWVGPEGDFTPEETEAILATGARPITLGPRVLRTETAAVYCLSILNYELEPE